MPEETIGEVYAKISAEMDDFDRDIDKVYERLDKLEEKDVSIQAETKGVESAVGGLGTELSGLGGALSTVFHYLQQTSGGMSAMIDMATGFIGAGIDTFLVEVMIPLWDTLKEKIVGNDEATGNLSKKQAEWAAGLELAGDGLLKFKDSTQWSNEAMSDFRLNLEHGKMSVDEYGNTIFKVGEQLYYYDGATGQFLGRTKDLNTAVSELNADFFITSDLINDISAETGVLASDLKVYFEGGKEALEALWVADPQQFKGAKYLENVAEAAKEVRMQLGTMLVELGINPATGETLTEADLFRAGVTARDAEAGTAAEKVARYLLSGGS